MSLCLILDESSWLELAIDWFVYCFMFPACIVMANLAMLTGISGTAMLTHFLILVLPILSVPTLTPGQAVEMAPFTEFFGFSSGVVGYQRARLISILFVVVGVAFLYMSAPKIL